MKIFWVIFSIGILTFQGCGDVGNKKGLVHKVSELKVKDSVLEIVTDEEYFKPFYVYEDKGSRGNHYIPSGFMPNGKCLNFSETWQNGCQSGKTCIRVEYDLVCSEKDQKWAGIYWLNPANNWGSRRGGFNLEGAKKFVFWARGDRGGEQIQEIIIGGVEGDYPDSDKIVFGPIILEKNWKKYVIDLNGKDLSYISGGFSWSTEVAVNPTGCIFYFDEMRFE